MTKENIPKCDRKTKEKEQERKRKQRARKAEEKNKPVTPKKKTPKKCSVKRIPTDQLQKKEKCTEGAELEVENKTKRERRCPQC